MSASVSKESDYKSEHVGIFKKIRNDIDFFESSEPTNEAMKRWFDDIISQLV